MEDTDQRRRIWSTWLLRGLWMIQNVWLFVIMGLEIHYQALESMLSTSLAVVIVIVLCITLNLSEMVAFATNSLHPIFYLGCQVVKTAIWLGFSVFAVYGTFALRDLWLVDGNSGPFVEEGLPALGIAVPVVTLIFCVPPLVYASVVAHRWRKGNRGRPRQSSEAEEVLHVFAQQGGGLSTHGEPFSPRFNHDGSTASVIEDYSVQDDFLPVKTADLFPGEGAAHEMVPAYTARENMGFDFFVQDAGGPYELPDRRSMASVRSIEPNETDSFFSNQIHGNDT